MSRTFRAAVLWTIVLVVAVVLLGGCETQAENGTTPSQAQHQAGCH